MGLFTVAPEFRDGGSIESPAIPISSENIVSLLGGGLSTDSGVNVNEFSAFRTSTYWRCVSLIAGIIATLPLNPYQGIRDAPGPKKLGDSGSVLYRPPDGYTLMTFKEQLMVHVLTWGNAYIRLVWNNARTEVVQFILYRPWEVMPSRINGTGSPKRYSVINGPTNLDDEEMIHVYGLGYDGVRGLSPVGFARQTIGLAIATEEYGAKFFGSGALLGGILKAKDRLRQGQAEEVKARFRDRVSGLARAHEPLVLDNDMDWQPVTVPPDEAQFLQTRQFSVEEVCRWFGVPPHLTGAVDKTSSWGAGVAEQTLGFVRFTIGFWSSRVEQAFDKVLPVGQYAAFDLDRLLRGDALQRAAFYASAVNVGWMSRAEVREKENLEAAPSAAGLEQFETSLTEAIASAAAKGLVNPDGSPKPPAAPAPPANPPEPSPQPLPGGKAKTKKGT